MLILAKTPELARQMAEQLGDDQMTKRYVTIVHGAVPGNAACQGIFV